MTKYFADRERVIATDLDPVACETLRNAFREQPGVRVGSLKFPLDRPEIEDLLNERLDTAICSNVLEHIEDDRTTLSQIQQVLQPEGRLIVLVPAMPRLYGTLDRELHHFRRYSRPELESKLQQAGFQIEDVRFLNRPGVFGWYLNSRVLRRRVLPKGQLRMFALLRPLLDAEVENPPSYGMSLLAVARKPSSSETAPAQRSISRIA
jgi:SAM-dependent methyltransferase